MLLVIQGDLTVGQLIAFRIISGYVVGPLLNLATSWQSFQQVALSIERLSDVVDAPAEGEDSSVDLLPLPPIAGDVSFQGVDFKFNESSPKIVKNVSFNVPAGSFNGIVGSMQWQKYNYETVASFVRSQRQVVFCLMDMIFLS